MDPIKNFALVTVSTGYDASATSIVLATGAGAELPDPSADGAYNLTWWNSTDYNNPADDPNVELVRVTGPAGTGDTKTVTRAQEGTSATTKNTSGKTYKMVLSMTKVVYDTLVDLTTAQTLTNKTLTSPVLDVGVSGTAVLDEDDMSSDSATQVATQQSIKAYGDSGTQTMTNKTLTSPVLNVSLSGSAFLDEDDMSSDAADKVASQQSIKAYSDSGTQTMTNKTLTSAVLNVGVSGSAVLDEDDMSSDSATQIATQQSIKAYSDTGTQTLQNKTIGVNNTIELENATFSGT